MLSDDWIVLIIGLEESEFEALRSGLEGNGTGEQGRRDEGTGAALGIGGDEELEAMVGAEDG